VCIPPLINKISFLNLLPYPLTITASDFSKLPVWKKLQLEHDNLNVSLKPNFRVEKEDLENKTIQYRFEFNNSSLLVHTPKDWDLPNSKFNIYHDVYRIIHSIGGCYSLFKFINKTNKYKPTYKAFEKLTISKFENYTIGMTITLVKTNKTEFSPKTFDVKTEQSQILNLPTIFEDYSHYIWYKTNNDSGTNTANYWQNIYFPLMLKLGYANYDKYQANNKKFDQANNPGWDYLTVNVTYNTPSQKGCKKEKILN
jgi:hypothetical protein